MAGASPWTPGTLRTAGRGEPATLACVGVKPAELAAGLHAEEGAEGPRGRHPPEVAGKSRFLRWRRLGAEATAVSHGRLYTAGGALDRAAASSPWVPGVDTGSSEAENRRELGRCRGRRTQPSAAALENGGRTHNPQESGRF